MSHFINSWRRICGAAVSSPRRAKVPRHRHSSDALEKIAVGAHEDFRPAAQPARLVSDRTRPAVSEGNGNTEALIDRIATLCSAQVHARAAAGITTIRINGRTDQVT